MALITVGLHTNNYVAIIGALILAVAHASSSSALFIIFGQVLYDRLHTRCIFYIRNISTYLPTLRNFLIVAIVANAATPTTVNWLGEFMILAGSSHNNLLVTFLMTSTVLLTALYSFWMLTYVTSNSSFSYSIIGDCTKRETATLLYLLIPNFILGLYPSLIETGLIDCSIRLTY
jgi:NADH-quinone oxidoreductase subunit M